MVSTRRELLVFAALGTFTVAVSPLELLAQDDEKKTEITEEEITKLMSRATVEDILKEEHDAGKIQYVTVNKDGKTNYDQLVYQRDLDAKNRKPVLVLFYRNEGEALLAQKRVAIIVRSLAQCYEGQMRVVCMKADLDDYKSARSERVLSSPSLALYSPFDVTKGETAENNCGKIRQIDILPQGPAENAQIKNWISLIKTQWLGTNVIYPNGKYVKRVLGADKPKLQEVYYSK